MLLLIHMIILDKLTDYRALFLLLGKALEWSYNIEKLQNQQKIIILVN